MWPPSKSEALLRPAWNRNRRAAHRATLPTTTHMTGSTMKKVSLKCCAKKHGMERTELAPSLQSAASARSRRLTKSLLMLMGGRVCAWCRSSGKRCCVPWLDASPLRASYARPGWLETPRTWNTKGSGTKTDSHGNTLLDSVWAREKNDLILHLPICCVFVVYSPQNARDKNNRFLRQQCATVTAKQRQQWQQPLPRSAE